MPHIQYFADTLLGMSSCASYVSRTHDVIDDVSRSHSRSDFEMDLSSSIFKPDRRSKVQNIGNANGYLSGIYSTSRITSGEKFCRELKMAAILKILKYRTQLQLDLRYEKIVPNYVIKSFFMMMTSPMTSQGGLKVGPLYSCINERTAFFIIKNKKRAKISPLNFLCIGSMRLWLHLHECAFMTSLMMSPGGHLNKKDGLTRYGNSHVKDKTS